MTRHCYLVVDREFSSTISTRKLIIETAKINVITAYSGHEAIETIRKFPAIDGVVIDSHLHDIPAEEVITRIKTFKPSLPVIAIHARGGDACEAADYQLESLSPENLLNLIRKLHPEDAAFIERRNQELHASEIKAEKP